MYLKTRRIDNLLHFIVEHTSSRPIYDIGWYFCTAALKTYEYPHERNMEAGQDLS